MAKGVVQIPLSTFLFSALGMLPSVHFIIPRHSQKSNHNGHYEELSRAGSSHGDDRLWRLWKGAGPEVIPLMDPRSLALGKRLFICQDVKDRLSGNAVSISPDFPMATWSHLAISVLSCFQGQA